MPIKSQVRLSVIIPSYKDPLLQKTIESLLENAEGEIEIVAVLDGYLPTKPIKEDSRVKVVYLQKNTGMRNAINLGVKNSRGEYIMKSDEHCKFEEGFDIKLLSNIENNWIVVPRRYKLDTDNWIVYNEPPIDYEKLIINRSDRICGTPWSSRALERKAILLDETMVFQGSCYVMSREHWDWLGGLQEEGYGKFSQESNEICLKTWLGGGKVMVNKTTWYAHKHRKHGRTYKFSPSKEIAPGNAYSRDFWLNNRWEKRVHDLKWLFDRFKLKYNPSI